MAKNKLFHWEVVCDYCGLSQYMHGRKHEQNSLPPGWHTIPVKENTGYRDGEVDSSKDACPSCWNKIRKGNAHKIKRVTK